jgi:multiple sugar transport system permease protein
MATTSPALQSSSPRRWRPGAFFDRTFKFWALLPTLIAMAALTIYPVIQLLRMSVSDLGFVKGKLVWTYVGLNNVDKLQSDVVLPNALKISLEYVVIVVAVETVLGLALALLVSRVSHLAWLYRGIYIMPLLIPPIAIGVMWSLMYDYNYGIINKLLYDLGLMSYRHLPLWTADPHRALSSVMIVDVWHWTSFLFLILLAGVESLPHELAEAARVDGANERQVILHVFLPLLRPTIIVAVMLRTILAFKVFDQIYLLTNGGPGTATEVISLYIYKVYFEQSRLGYGALLALVTAVIISVFVIFYLLLNAYMNRSASR